MAVRRTHIWKSLWFALRRSGKDERARRAVLGVLVSILVVAGYVWRLLYFLPNGDAFPHDRWTLAFYAFIFGTGGVAFLVIRRVRQSDDSATLSLRPEIVADPTHTEDAGVRDYLRDRLIIVSSLVMRASSEQYLRHNTVPEGAEVVTRQIHNRALRESGAWERLEPDERDLLFVADGGWTDAQIDEIVTWSEQLRLLRWVLGIDAAIEPLAHFPSVDASLSREALDGKPLPETPMLGPWDVRPERDTSLAYAARCFAELRARGLAQEDSGAWADAFRAECLGDSTDLVVGARTVADLEDRELRLLAAMAIARERYAAWLVEQLSAKTAVPFSVWLAESEQEPQR